MTTQNAECGALFPQLVARLFAVLLERLPAFLSSHGYTDIRLTHVLNVFLHLGKDGQRPAELARRAGMTPQSMSELIAHLERSRYVERIPDPTDGRSKLVVYAPRGLTAAAQLSGWMEALDADWSHLIGNARTEESTRSSLLALAQGLEMTSR